MKKKRKANLLKKIKNSPIDYFSDLTMMSAVIAWIIASALTILFAVYATVFNKDSAIWQDVFEIIAIPMTAFALPWMLKSKEQHIIAYKKGKKVPKDFEEESEEEF